MVNWCLLPHPLSLKKAIVVIRCQQIACNKYQHGDSPKVFSCQSSNGLCEMTIHHLGCIKPKVKKCDKPIPTCIGRFFWNHQLILLMVQKSINTWDVQNPVNNGINYQPQLVSRISSINSTSRVSLGLCGWCRADAGPTLAYQNLPGGLGPNIWWCPAR